MRAPKIFFDMNNQSLVALFSFLLLSLAFSVKIDSNSKLLSVNKSIQSSEQKNDIPSQQDESQPLSQDSEEDEDEDNKETKIEDAFERPFSVTSLKTKFVLIADRIFSSPHIDLISPPPKS